MSKFELQAEIVLLGVRAPNVLRNGALGERAIRSARNENGKCGSRGQRRHERLLQGGGGVQRTQKGLGERKGLLPDVEQHQFAREAFIVDAVAAAKNEHAWSGQSQGKADARAEVLIVGIPESRARRARNAVGYRYLQVCGNDEA